MRTQFHFKQSYFLLGIALLLVVAVLILVIASLSSENEQSQQGNLPIPTPVPYTRQKDGTFSFSPFQRTTINKTTSKEIEDEQKILNKSLRGSTTVYEVPSATPQETDEIRTKDGIVVFESINIFNNKAGMPPKVSVYEKEFGKSEDIRDRVSPLGKHISAHIYAEEGFTLFVNRYTNTVYEVHRYTPMSTSEYEDQFGEYLEPAPEYPREFLGD